MKFIAKYNNRQETTAKKISARYNFTKDQLGKIKKRILPALFISFSIWIITAIEFSRDVLKTPYAYISHIESIGGIYLILLLSTIPLYIITHFVSKKGYVKPSFILLLILSFVFGLIYSNVLILVYVDRCSRCLCAMRCDYFSTIGFALISYIGISVFVMIFGLAGSKFGPQLGAKFFSKYYIRIHLIYFGFGIIFAYFGYFFNGIFSEMAVIPNILYGIILVFTFYILINTKALMSSHLKEDNWVFWCLNLFIVFIALNSIAVFGILA